MSPKVHQKSIYDQVDDDGENLIDPNSSSYWFQFKQTIYDNSFVQLLILIGLCAFIGIGTPILWNNFWPKNHDSTIESDLRFDCYPLKPLGIENRHQRHSLCNHDVCLWDNFTKPNTIDCYYGLEKDQDFNNEKIFIPHYGIQNKTNDFEYTLKMLQKPPFIKNEKNEDLTENPVIHELLSLSIQVYSKKHLSVLIKPLVEKDKSKWSKQLDYKYLPHNKSIVSDAIVSVTNEVNSNFFQLKIVRRSSRTTIFNQGAHAPFIFADGNIEMTTFLINDLIYGLGQSNQKFLHNFSSPRQWTMFNQYHENLTENTETLFGSHPFYLGIDNPNTGDAYGVLLVNTFPIEVILNSRPSMTLRTIGGFLEFHFFLGPSATDVIRQLQEFIHFPAMPPYWALGFHICQTRCSISQTIGKLENLQIPIESDCGTSMPISSADFSKTADRLQKQQMKWISAVSPHLIVDSTKTEFWSSNLLLDHQTEQPYQGKVRGCKQKSIKENVAVYYPDFFNQETTHQKYQTLLNDKADGYLLDWNTPINLANKNVSCSEMLKRYHWNYYKWAAFHTKNPCMDLWFSDSKIIKNDSNLNIIGPYLSKHNLYGFKHSQAVFKKMSNQKKRPFIMSLSTFIGNGRFGGHISTPINRAWTMLRFSLKQMLDFSLYGIPMTGFPVGGYQGNEITKLLLRQWYQLASMQPFMITYNGFMTNNDQQSMSSVLNELRDSIRSSIRTRYQIIPYLYTLFYRAHEKGDLVAQPLFFQFPTDPQLYKVDEQYMLGPALMISPVLDPDNTAVKIYFPEGRWYDFYSGHIAWNQNAGSVESSAVNINIHLRGGHVVLTQNTDKLTLEETRVRQGFQMVGGFDEKKMATGEFYLDHGDRPMPAKMSMLISFKADHNNITISIKQTGEFCRDIWNQGAMKYNTILESIKLFGVIDPLEKNRMKIFKQDDRMNSLEFLKELSTLKEVVYDDKFGVLTINPNIDLCHLTDQTYLLNWTHPMWF